MLVEAEIWSIARIGEENAVLIRPVGSEVAVPIFIDPFQTQSILIGLGNVDMPRPLTHDLLLTVLESLQVTVERVEITSLKDGIYYAQIILNRTDDKLVIDSRPSDAIALAVRLKCAIFIAESVVEEAGSEISSITSDSEDDESDTAEGATKKDMLEEKLQKAVEEENYEAAALIRDKIKDLDGPNEPS